MGVVFTRSKRAAAGSVKTANCDALSSCADIDGFLVGGASLMKDFPVVINSGAE